MENRYEEGKRDNSFGDASELNSPSYELLALCVQSTVHASVCVCMSKVIDACSLLL